MYFYDFTVFYYFLILNILSLSLSLAQYRLHSTISHESCCKKLHLKENSFRNPRSWEKGLENPPLAPSAANSKMFVEAPEKDSPSRK